MLKRNVNAITLHVPFPMEMFLRIFRYIVTAAMVICATFSEQAYGGQKPIRFKPIYAKNQHGLTTAVGSDRRKGLRIGLALAGGGARAAAAVGVLKVLEEEGIPVSAIAGTSMGALVGGLYAAGNSPEDIEGLIHDNAWIDVFRDTPARAFLTQEQKEAGSRHLFEFYFRGGRFIIPSGLTAGQKFANILTEHTLAASFQAKLDFDRLRIPFRAVAADIETGDAVVVSEGMLHDAIRASAAIPILFAPVKLKGRLLVDGGIANNLPVNVAKAMGSDIVIAVDASTKPIAKENLTSLFSVMSQTITLQVQRGARRQAALADIVILPDTAAYSFSDFPKIKEIVATGEQAARAALPAIQKLLRRKAGTPFPITGLTIKGNVRVTDAIIRETMAASLRSLRATRDDLHAAMAAVFNLGLFSDITADLVKARSGYRMVLTVVENPVVRDVQISGNRLVPTEEIRSAVNPVVGKTLNSTDLSAALTTIVDRYREKGYRLVRVTRAGMQEDTGTLGITLYEGLVTSVRLTGQKRTKPSLFRREIRTGPGDPLNFNTLIQDVRHFYGLGYYESLNIKMQEGADGGVELTFHVKEKPTGRVRLGMRYDVEDSFTGLTDIQVKNWTGRDIRLYLNTRYGSYTDIHLGYHAPIFLSANFIHTLQAFYYQRDYALYTNKKQTSEKDVARTGVDFAVGYQGFKFGDAHVRYRYTSDRTRDGLGPGQTKIIDRIGSLALLMTIDTRDSSTFANQGLLFRGSYETAAPAYGGDRSFRKTSLLARSSIPLGKRHTVALEADAGFGSGAIPYHEEYGIGGADYLLGFPLFGYERREFTGTNLLGLSLSFRWKIKEYQFKAVKAVYLSIAGQAANVWNSREAMTFRDLRGGGGVGIHADTLVGPFRLDFGVGEEDRFRVYFSAGFDF